MSNEHPTWQLLDTYYRSLEYETCARVIRNHEILKGFNLDEVVTFDDYYLYVVSEKDASGLPLFRKVNEDGSLSNKIFNFINYRNLQNLKLFGEYIDSILLQQPFNVTEYIHKRRAAIKKLKDKNKLLSVYHVAKEKYKAGRRSIVSYMVNDIQIGNEYYTRQYGEEMLIHVNDKDIYSNNLKSSVIFKGPWTRIEATCDDYSVWQKIYISKPFDERNDIHLFME